MSILTQKEIIMRGREVHGDLYDYSLVEYITYHTKIKIKCQGHGIFEQTPANHIHRKSGCPKCAITHKPQHMPHPTKKFIEKANKVHDNLYDYSNIDYKNTHTPIEIICQEHGPFMQRPVKHLQGCNCPKCSFSSKGERLVRKFLIANNIEFEEQKQFTDCYNPQTGKSLKYDFFIPSKNLLIEIDGIQHFEPTRFNGISFERAEKIFEGTVYRDNVKNYYASNNDITLVRLYGDALIKKLKAVL